MQYAATKNRTQDSHNNLDTFSPMIKKNLCICLPPDKHSNKKTTNLNNATQSSSEHNFFFLEQQESCVSFVEGTKGQLELAQVPKKTKTYTHNQQVADSYQQEKNPG
jgi:hypothetical protein